ncbi:hypothetical protein BKA93DRAFT_510777 [Sparassis latifolia]
MHRRPYSNRTFFSDDTHECTQQMRSSCQPLQNEETTGNADYHAVLQLPRSGNLWLLSVPRTFHGFYILCIVHAARDPIRHGGRLVGWGITSQLLDRRKKAFPEQQFTTPNSGRLRTRSPLFTHQGPKSRVLLNFISILFPLLTHILTQRGSVFKACGINVRSR